MVVGIRNVDVVQAIYKNAKREVQACLGGRPPIARKTRPSCSGYSGNNACIRIHLPNLMQNTPTYLTDVDVPRPIHKNTSGIPCPRLGGRDSIPVLRSSARYSGDDTRLCIHLPNPAIVLVRNIEVACVIHSKVPRAIQSRLRRRPSIACITARDRTDLRPTSRYGSYDPGEGHHRLHDRPPSQGRRLSVTDTSCRDKDQRRSEPQG